MLGIDSIGINAIGQSIDYPIWFVNLDESVSWSVKSNPTDTYTEINYPSKDWNIKHFY